VTVRKNVTILSVPEGCRWPRFIDYRAASEILRTCTSCTPIKLARGSGVKVMLLHGRVEADGIPPLWKAG